MNASIVHLLLLLCMTEGGGGRDKNRDSLVDIMGRSLVMRRCAHILVQEGRHKRVINSVGSQKAMMRAQRQIQDTNAVVVELDGQMSLYPRPRAVVSSPGYCLTVLGRGGLQCLTLVPRPTTPAKEKERSDVESESALETRVVLQRV